MHNNFMWLIIMFDLPTDTKADLKRYNLFRKSILELGFHMTQFSVYSKVYRTRELAKTAKKQIKKIIPPYGQVRILEITDIQWKNTHIYHGKVQNKPEKPPEQTLLF